MIRNNNNNNQQNGRRRGRGGGQGGGAGMGAPRAPGSQNYGNNRLDIRQRGNATQLLDKYKALARDAAQQGDRVASEYYLQYADHYFRVLNEIRERQPEHQRGPRPGYDADEDGDDVGNGYNPAYAGGSTDAQQQDGDSDDGGDRQRYDAGQRGDDRPRENSQRDNNAQRDNGQRDNGQRQYEARSDNRGQDNRSADARSQPEPRRDDIRRDSRGERNGNGAGNARAEYRDAPRRDAAPRDDYRNDSPRADEEYRDEPRRDAEPAPREAEPLLAGLPGPATLSVSEADSAAPADAVEAPRRRRGRPRKVDPAAAVPDNFADA